MDALLTKEELEYLRIVRRCDRDPVYFIEEVCGVKMLPMQREIMKDFYRDKYDPSLSPYRALVLPVGMRCVSVNNDILTSAGVKKAKDITTNDYLWNGFYWETPLRVYSGKICYARKITTESGASLITSQEHKFLTSEGWKQCIDLNIGDIVYNSNEHRTFEDKIIDSVNVSSQEMVDFEMRTINQYACSNIIVHNSGKTMLTSMITTYAFSEVITKPDPAQHWGLVPGQLISLTAVANSEKTVLDGIFHNVAGFIENSEFFQTWFNIDTRAGDIHCPAKNCKIRALSSSGNTGAGRSNYFVAFDEADLMVESDAWNVYNTLSKSVITFGSDGRYAVISSPRSTHGIMMTLYQRATQRDEQGNPLAPHIYARKLATWEMNPQYSKEALLEEFKYDIDRFWADFACEPGLLSNIQFENGVLLKPMRNVLLDPDSYTGRDPHVLAIDPSVKGDAFGMAVAYYDGVRDKFVVDGVTNFRREETSARIDSQEIREFVGKIVLKLGIDTVIHDTYLYPELLDYLEKDLGVNLVFNVANKVEYDLWKAMQNQDRLEVCYNDTLKYEADRLIIKKLPTKYRIDHPANGSKDMADCVANCVAYLFNNYQSYMRAPIVVCRGF